jgi:hypothetical protein
VITYVNPINKGSFRKNQSCDQRGVVVGVRVWRISESGEGDIKTFSNFGLRGSENRPST